MLAGRDCAYPPSDAELAAAWAAGVRVWGVYFAGLNVLFGWSDADILRVKAKGFVVIAFCSGYADPAAMGARARALGVLVCLDDESGMRPDGDWVEGWCATAGAGLYGNGSFHYNAQGIRAAAFHIFAGYYGYDPGATWPSFDVRPATPCGWQWLGSHAEFGGTVDSALYDDSFAARYGVAAHEPSAQPKEGENLASGFTDNYLHVVGRGTDNGYWHRRADASGAWSAWQSLGGVFTGPAQVVGSGSRLDVFGIGTDKQVADKPGGGLWHIYSNDEGATWSAWESDSGQFQDFAIVGRSTATAAPDVSSIAQAVTDAKTAAVAAQAAAQAAQAAQAQALTVAQGTAADVTAIRIRIEKDLAS